MYTPLKKLQIGFTSAIRNLWFKAEGMQLNWPQQYIQRPPPKNYRNYAAEGCAEGDFILDLAKFNTEFANPEKKQYEFALIGCQGVDTTIRTSGRRPVQAVMGEMVVNPRADNIADVTRTSEAIRKMPERFDAKIFLGDNFYDFGVTDPLSSYFKKAFGQYYSKSDDRCPNFIILGNHDWNFHGNSEWGWGASSLERAMCQVYHSYIKTDNSYSWEMPYLYYALTSPLINFICIDSNTIIFDIRQQYWLNKIYKKLAAENKWLVLVSHHPLDYYGSRRDKKEPEWEKYQQPDQAAKNPEFSLKPKIFHQFSLDSSNGVEFLETGNFLTIGSLLKCMIEKNNYHFDAILCAHEHAMALTGVPLTFADGKQGSILQAISGGGGAKLNDVDTCLLDDTVGYYRRSAHGFAQLTVNNTQLSVKHIYLHDAGKITDRSSWTKHNVTIRKDYKYGSPRGNEICGRS